MGKHSNKTHQGLVHAICSAPEHDLSAQHLWEGTDLQGSSLRAMPPANLHCGYNVITVPSSLKARLRLQEEKAKENLRTEPTMSYPQCTFHTILFSLLFHEDTEQPAPTQPKMLVLLQKPNSHHPVCVVLPCALSPDLHPAWPIMPTSRNPTLGSPVLLGDPWGAGQPQHGQCERSALGTSSSSLGCLAAVMST